MILCPGFAFTFFVLVDSSVYPVLCCLARYSCYNQKHENSIGNHPCLGWNKK